MAGSLLWLIKSPPSALVIPSLETVHHRDPSLSLPLDKHLSLLPSKCWTLASPWGSELIFIFLFPGPSPYFLHQNICKRSDISALSGLSKWGGNSYNSPVNSTPEEFEQGQAEPGTWTCNFLTFLHTGNEYQLSMRIRQHNLMQWQPPPFQTKHRLHDSKLHSIH